MKFNSILPAIIFLVFSACQAPQQNPANLKETELTKVQWSSVASVNIDEVNSDLEEGKPTVDIGIYMPSNLDPDFNKVTLEKMMESYLAAKEIYAPTGVQLNLKFVKTGEIDPAFLAIQANEIPQVPATEYANTYVNMKRNPAQLTEKAKKAF